VVAGSRDYPLTNNELGETLHKLGLDPSLIISGGARGPDYTAVTYAKKYDIPLNIFYADWNNKGRGAGMQRNRLMAEAADVLVAFWDGQSKGTANMIDNMKRLGKPVHIIQQNPTP